MSSDREIRAILFRCKRAYYILPFAFVYIDMYTHTHTHTHRFKYTIIFIDFLEIFTSTDGNDLLETGVGENYLIVFLYGLVFFKNHAFMILSGKKKRPILFPPWHYVYDSTESMKERCLILLPWGKSLTLFEIFHHL